MSFYNKKVNSNTEKMKMNLLDVNEASKLLRVKPNTLYTWKYQKKIPYVKKYGKLLFKEDTLLDFINSGEVAQINVV